MPNLTTPAGSDSAAEAAPLPTGCTDLEVKMAYEFYSKLLKLQSEALTAKAKFLLIGRKKKSVQQVVTELNNAMEFSPSDVDKVVAGVKSGDMDNLDLCKLKRFKQSPACNSYFSQAALHFKNSTLPKVYSELSADDRNRVKLGTALGVAGAAGVTYVTGKAAMDAARFAYAIQNPQPKKEGLIEGFTHTLLG
jgi:hypothetical protein